MTTALGVAAASWAMLMALSPLLQVREIRRRRSSAGVSIGYFCVLLRAFVLHLRIDECFLHDGVPLTSTNERNTARR